MSQVNEPAGSAQYVHIESEKNTILQNHGRRPWYVYSSSIWPKYDLIRVKVWRGWSALFRGLRDWNWR